MSQFLTMLGFLAGAPLARRMGSVGAIVLTELLSIPFFVILALTRDLRLAVLAFWMRGALMNMNHPISSNFTMEMVPPDQHTVTNSLRMLSWNVSWMVSTQVGGWLIQRNGYTAPMVVTIGLYAVAAVTFFVFFGRSLTLGQGPDVCRSSVSVPEPIPHPPVTGLRPPSAGRNQTGSADGGSESAGR